jgi:hypothetical protein
MEALVTLLTREKTLVELLVFKLVSMRQLLLAGETRFLPWAAEEVERATDVVREAELERAVLVIALSAERGLTEPVLSELITDAPDIWRSMLEDLQTDLGRNALEVQDLLRTVRRLAEVGSRSIAEAMGEDLQPLTGTYGPAGRVERAAAHRYEQAL